MTLLVHTWLNEPGWHGLDALLRGLHVHFLMTATHQDPLGTLPADPDTWLQWLSVTPEAPAHQLWVPLVWPEGMTRWSEKEQHLAHHWRTVWYPRLAPLWQTPTPQLKRAYPHLKGSKQRVFSPLAWHLAQAVCGSGTPQQASPSPVVKKATARKKRDTPSLLPALPEQHTWALDTSCLMQPLLVERLLRPPVTQKERHTLWDVGVSLLREGATPQAERGARVFLGKLVKTYGEQAVGQAIAHLGTRSQMPADSRSWLITHLQDIAAGGTKAEQTARTRRADVAL